MTQDQKIQSAYQEESQQLIKTAAEIDQQMKYYKSIPRYYGHDFTEQILEDMREAKRRNLAIAIKEPYFGRLDFQEKNQEKAIPLYIGKVGVEDEKTGKLLVIDWRAPVASMFYSINSETELASYDSPEGTVEGTIYLKRNLVIRNQILQRVVDTYIKGNTEISVNDEFLLYRLSEHKDSRLRDIVSSIQAEQDQIIRASINTPIIIQGVAGSGKTTVALHRLAYLLYQYRENIHSERLIIFAPNSMFLDYISNVLPELGVGNIQQTTFTNWVLNILDEDIKLVNRTEMIEKWLAVGPRKPEINNVSPGRFKGSIHFMNLLNQWIEHYEESFVPDKDFEAYESTVLNNEFIRQWFYAEYRHYPIIKRKERVVARIKRWLEMELEKITNKNLQKELKKKANLRLRAYLNKWPNHTPYSFYKLLFTSTNKGQHFLPQSLLNSIPEEVLTHSNHILKKKQVDNDDLAPLLFIHHKFYGIDKKNTFDHVVIDEAQDFSPFQITLLKEHTKRNSFTILGDLSQGIFSYQGIVNWEEFAKVFDDHSKYFELEKSYRSTTEIIHFANEVLSSGYEPKVLAKPFFRSGNQVKLMNVAQEKRISELLRVIKELQEEKISTLAVVGRTLEASKSLYDTLYEAGLHPTFIDTNQEEYKGGLSVLPVYLTKGLEFDAVIIMDVDAVNYEKTEQDAKLLYVGCTRALHDLWLFYSEEISPLIKEIDSSLYI